MNQDSKTTQRTPSIPQQSAPTQSADPGRQEQPNAGGIPRRQAPASDRNIQGDLEEFRQTFPEIYILATGNPDCIPDQVWELVRQGMTLTQAMQSFLDSQENRIAQNGRRSVGSMKSAGQDTPISDPFLRGFRGNG